METPLPPSPSTPVKLDSQKKETDQSQEKEKKEEGMQKKEASQEKTKEAPTPSPAPEETSSGCKKLSALKTGLSYVNTLMKQLRPILSQWKPWRVTVTFPIKLPKSKAKRTEYLARELNKFLIAAKKVSPNNQTIYVRKFKDHAPISDAEKNYWIDSFGSTQMSHLMEYTHGFYANQALQDGTFCLTVQIVILITMDISPFLDILNGLWSNSNNKMVRDCNEQALYNPARVYLSPPPNMMGIIARLKKPPQQSLLSCQQPIDNS